MAVISGGGKGHGVFEQREVEVYATVDMQLAEVDASHAKLARDIVMERLALCLGNLSAHAQRVFVPRAHAAGVGQGVVVQLMCGKNLDPGLGPFVETLEQRYGEGVAKVPVLGLVVDGVVAKSLLDGERIEVIVLGCGVGGIDAVVIIELGGMDETCHRHILVLGPRGVFGGFFRGGDQAVGSLLAVHTDACVATGRVGRCDNLGRPFRDLGSVGSPAEGLRHREVVVVDIASGLAGLLHGLLLALRGLGLFLRGHRKLLGGNLLSRHGNLAVIAHDVSLGEEQPLVVVAIPVA